MNSSVFVAVNSLSCGQYLLDTQEYCQYLLDTRCFMLYTCLILASLEYLARILGNLIFTLNASYSLPGVFGKYIR